MNVFARSVLSRNFNRMAWLAALFTASTILFGGFVRLSDAGMSCPDWPTCYGRITWPTTNEEANQHKASQIRPLETQKAWREQIHRFLASALGIEACLLALTAARRRRRSVLTICGSAALVLLSIPFYLAGAYTSACILALLGELVLLVAAWRWSNEDLARASTLNLAIVIFQALLGMWTVTMLLRPIVVMGHLMGAICMFSLLVWMAWRATDLPITVADKYLPTIIRGSFAVLMIQIALGGWVSANYASLACGGGQWTSVDNFPQCVGEWWPIQDYRQGFTLSRSIGVDYEGGVLDGPARIAIQMAHRIWAIITTVYLGGLVWYLWRLPGLRGWAIGLLIILLSQFTLGVFNVKLALPLVVGVMHNGGAVALTFILVSLLARIRAPG